MRLLVYLKVVLMMTCLSSISYAQTGSLDNTFGSGGKVITSLGNFGDKGNSLAIQSDGKMLLGGTTQTSFTTSNFALVRCNNDGSLDTTFGIGGKVNTVIDNRSEGHSVAVQSDGKILLGGFSRWFINLSRYNSNGTLDTTFGTDGKLITDIIGYYSEKCKSLAIQGDGKIIVGGYGMHNANDNAYFILVRYHTNGSLDSSFGNNGQVIGRAGIAYAMAIQNDGKILLGGASNYNFALARYNTNGTLDSSFGIGGELTTPVGTSSEANTICIQSNGKILLGGYTINGNNPSDFALVRYNRNGDLDNGFGTSGKVITPVGTSNSKGYSVGMQSDGKILLAGNASYNTNISDFAIARYDSNGTLDNSFGTSGKVITPIGPSYSSASSLGIQSNGKIVLSGYAYDGTKTDMVLVRYHINTETGIAETNAQQQGCIIYPNPFNTSTRIQFNKQPHQATINIYNVYGQVVKQITNISSPELLLFRNDLPNGIYFLHLIEENKLISLKKLVID